jgi:hypothetical protein
MLCTLRPTPALSCRPDQPLVPWIMSVGTLRKLQLSCQTQGPMQPAIQSAVIG